MDAGTILYVDFISNPDEIYVATYHCIEPNAAIIAHDHVAHNCGIRSNKAIYSELGMFVFNRKYDWHIINTNIRKQVKSKFLALFVLQENTNGPGKDAL